MLNLSDLFLSLMHYVGSILGNYKFLLAATSLSISLKIFILSILIKRGVLSNKTRWSFIFLLVFIIGAIVSDFAWIFKLCQLLFFRSMDYRFLLFSIRISWGFSIIQYQSLALFIENLTNKKNNIKTHQKIFLLFSSIISLFFVILAFYKFNCFATSDRPNIEFNALKLVSIYNIFPLMISTLFIASWKLRVSKIPRILKRQIKILIQFIIFPLLIAEFIQVYPFILVSTIVSNAYATAGFSTLLLTYAIFHCMRKIMGLRFLNLENHVQAPKKFSFINDFKNILDQFTQVTSTKELGHITQNFFNDAFNIPTRRTRLYIRNLENKNKSSDLEKHYATFENEETTVESFANSYDLNTEIGKYLRKKSIIINDELEFSNFYDENETRSAILQFMNNIAADIFIPIFENGSMAGYIIVEKYARVNHENKNAPFYSNVERDQMLVFVNYLGNIIKLLQTRSLNSIIKLEKELREEIYRKHQEVNQYKESIRSFLRTTQQKKIGVIFYKNRKFNFGNQTAQELIPIKLNTHDGHPITKTLKKIAMQVMEYKSPQTCFIQDSKGEKLVVSALLNTEQNNVIMIVYYPEISDILKRKIGFLKDPTKWDYLLYLETTQSGKLIKELIPGNGETLLNFKIDLLKLALSKKAILLDMPDQDLMPTVEILHHISLKESLHILDLQQPSSNFDTAIKLFGINPIFGIKTNNEKSLLEKLDNIGTLFIKNIHFLELETQKHLAEFIKYGFFKIFKGQQKTFSHVRIICSTNINLKTEMQDGKFSQALYDELNKTSVCMPSLMTLPEDELENLTSGFTQQAIKADEFQHLLELTDSEKQRLAKARPASFAELKNRVQNILVKKSKQSAIYEEAQFDPAYDISDPQLVEAVRLGKHALRDKKIMSMLWNKFGNQNKIANLLGVNRSSVNRRCKEYNLLD